MRPSSFLQRLAAQVGGSAPTAPAGRRAQRALLAEQTVREVLELAVRIGEAMLSFGASAADVTDVIRRVGRAFGLECQVDLTYTAILVAHDGAGDTGGVSVLRVVAAPGADYGRLSRVVDLVQRVVDDPRELQVADVADDPEVRAQTRRRLDEAHGYLDEIVSAPHRYRRVLVTVLLAVMAGAVAVLLGGGPLVVVVAAVTTALIDTAIRGLTHWGLPSFFLQAAGAAIATTVAVLLLVAIPGLPVEFTTLPPSLVVASGIVVLLAGMSLVGAADDAINGFPVTASARLFEVMLLTLGIVVGIGGVLDLARRLGVAFVIAEIPVNPWPLALQTLAAAVVAGAWAMSSYAGLRATLVAAVSGAIAYLTFTLLVALGAAAPAASAGAALLIGFAGEALASRVRIPAVVTTVCGIVPLLPGLSIYRGMLDLVSGEGTGIGGQLLLQAGMIGLALAAGVTLGEILARRLGASQRVLLPGYIRHFRMRKRRRIEEPTLTPDAPERVDTTAIEIIPVEPEQPAEGRPAP